MIDRAMKFVGSATGRLSPELIRRGLSKISPKFKNFFAQALSYGYSADQALDYLTNKFSNRQTRDYQSSLEERSRAQQLRPDEMSALASIESSQLPGKAIRTVLPYAAGLLLPELSAPIAAAGAAGTVAEGQEGAPAKGQQMAQKEAIVQEGSLNAFKTPWDVFMNKHPRLGLYLAKKLATPSDLSSIVKEARSIPSFKQSIMEIEEEAGRSLEDLLREYAPGRKGVSDFAQDRPNSRERFFKRAQDYMSRTQ